MKNNNNPKIALILSGLLAFSISTSATAWGGETEFYFKPGYFTWSEKINGQNFVKETGIIYSAGVSRRDYFFEKMYAAELFEVWGGKLDYDGYDITNTFSIKGDTNYLGTKEEAVVGMRFPFAEVLSIDPFAGVGHKFWIRSRSNEDWNTIYAKVGTDLSYTSARYIFFVKSGITVPLYTRNHISLGEAGFEDVVVYPKSRVSLFTEAGLKMGAWRISFGYEEMNFGESDRVSTRSTSSLQKGAVVSNNYVYQPVSDSSIIILKVSYNF